MRRRRRRAHAELVTWESRLKKKKVTSQSRKTASLSTLLSRYPTFISCFARAEASQSFNSPTYTIFAASSTHLERLSFCISSLFATEMAEPEPRPSHAMTDLQKSEEASAADGRNDATKRSLDEELVRKPAANPWMDPKAFPEGGAKAWLTVAGASTCLFVSFGWINCVGVFQEYYQAHQLKQYSASDISWIPALQSTGPFLFLLH